MTHQAPNPGDPAYDPKDPHGFHHDAAGHDTGHQHHVTSWQFLTLVLFALLFFTLLTVVVAAGESWITANTQIPITQLWNVIIAMSIATVKAMLVCMYFMHLRHDNPINTYIMLFTFVVLAIFLTFPSLDIGNRERVKGFGNAEPMLGGMGNVRLASGDQVGGGTSIVKFARDKKIAEVGEDQFWHDYYAVRSAYDHHHLRRHPDDANNHYQKFIDSGAHYTHDQAHDIERGHGAHGDHDSHGDHGNDASHGDHGDHAVPGSHGADDNHNDHSSTQTHAADEAASESPAPAPH